MIIKLVKTFKDSRRLYFLLEFVEGKDLFDVLRAVNTLDEAAAKFIISCLLLALKYLNGLSIVYRDLKPENILIDKEGYPRLIDFGTAKVIRARTFTILGTPHYMAPEVISGGSGMRADYWSLGVILYELLCGKVPFGNELDDPLLIYEQILEHQIDLSEGLQGNGKLLAVLEKLLARSPGLRGNFEVLKEFGWFHGTDWDALLLKHEKPEYIPKVDSIEISKAKVYNIVDRVSQEEINEMVDMRNFKAESPDWDTNF